MGSWEPILEAIYGYDDVSSSSIHAPVAGGQRESTEVFKEKEDGCSTGSCSFFYNYVPIKADDYWDSCAFMVGRLRVADPTVEEQRR